MELFKQFTKKFMGIVLACALIVPTIALGMGEKQEQKKTYGSKDRASLTSMGGLLVPFCMSKMGYDSQTSKKALVGEAFLAPTASYLAWEGWTWLANKFGSPEKTAQDKKNSKYEEIDTRKSLRTNIVTGGLSNIIAAVTIKKLLGSIKENKDNSWMLKASLIGLELGVQVITSSVINATWNWLFTKKEPAKITSEEQQKQLAAVIATPKKTPGPKKSLNKVVKRFGH